MRISPDYSKEFEKIADAYEKSGGDVSNLIDKRVASIIISGDKILGLNNVDGVEIEAGKQEMGVGQDKDFKGQENFDADPSLYRVPWR